MNLQELEALRFSEFTSVTVRGREWKIGKLSAADAPLVFKDANAIDVDDDKSASGIRFYSRLLSKCVLNGNGLAFDSDEAREKIPKLLNWEELKELGQAALSFNGLGDDAKKN